MVTPEKPNAPKSDEDLLEVARKRFKQAEEADIEIRKEALEDQRFSIGEQWDPEIKRQRELDRRPCLTINRLPNSIHQVTNDQRQNRPSIKVSPVDDNADLETAKVYQGLVRHIENISNADTAYDTAFDGGVRSGRGFFRVVTDYCDPKSFDQEPRIKRVPDPMSVYLDPSFREPDGSDANWGFVFEDISPEEFSAQYPNSKIASIKDWESLGADAQDWCQKDRVRIAEYFYRTHEETTIVLLARTDLQTGQVEKVVVEKSELPTAPEMLPAGFEILGERKTVLPKIKWAKINGVEVLEETDWPGRWIPIIPVLGEDLIVDGKRKLSGLVRYAKDSQRMYNVWASAEAEAIALAPRAPFIGAAGQFEGFEEQWSQANIKNFAFLEYNPKSLNGQPAPPPQRQAYEPAVQAITQARMMASEDLKATTGIYDAAMGAQSNETSGIAIQRRNVQAQTSNFHYIDNLSKSIRHCGRILVDLIPHIYDTDRVARIIGEDGTEEIIQLNKEFERNGQRVKYDLGVGKYDVSVHTGPSFETKRQEAAASMADLSRSHPQLMQIAGDLMVKNLDWPGAQEIAERLKKTLPPGIADDGKGQELPPEAQAQMQQMNQMIEMLTAKLNEAQDSLQTKRVEIESKERIEFAKLENQATIELAKLQSREAIEMLASQIAEIDARTKMLGMNQPLDFETEAQMAGPEMAAPEAAPESFQQQPTGGFSPGNYME